MDYALRNAWYAAAWSTDLPGGVLLERAMLDAVIVLFRDPAGATTALEDRCPHRFAPLSRGQLVDNGKSIRCGYHGLQFDGSGQCVFSPHGPAPRAARVRSYPVVERHAAIWIWMGDPHLADHSQIPDFPFLNEADWAIGTGTTLVECNYELETDNLLDLSHIEFLHPMFSSDAVRAAKCEFEQADDTVWSRRMIRDDDPPEFIRQAFKIPAGARVDRWLDARWNPPALVSLVTGGVAHGQPRDSGIDWFTAHFFTPESQFKTRYLWAIGFPRAMGPEAEVLAKESAEAIRVPFEMEDKPMIEAIQRRMGCNDFSSLNPVLLAGDSAAVRARRILKNRIEAEHASVVAVSAK